MPTRGLTYADAAFAIAASRSKFEEIQPNFFYRDLCGFVTEIDTCSESAGFATTYAWTLYKISGKVWITSRCKTLGEAKRQSFKALKARL